MRKRVVLIAPPWIFKEGVEFVSQNLGLGYLASYLQKHGHEVVIVDALIKGLGISSDLSTKYADVLRWGLRDEEIIKLIPQDSELIGVVAPFTDSRFIVNPLLRAIKKAFPNSIVVMGGVYPSTLPEEAIALSGADIVVMGEGEIPLSEIVAGKDWKEIGGIVFKRGGEIINTGVGKIVKDIENELPAPSYDLRPMEEYIKWSPRGNQKDKTLSMVSSRGCPFNCNFCSIHNVYGRRWRAFSAERVVNEIEYAIYRFGVNHVEFEDDNLTLKKDRAIKIFKGIKNLKDKGEEIRWTAPNGVMIQSLDKEVVVAMKESGGELIYLPVESGDEKILRLMNKVSWKTHLEKTLEVIKNCVEVGIETSAFIIVGYPGEDRESFEKTVNFCDKMRDAGVGAITPLVATPYPNTQLYKMCEDNGWLVHPDMENILIYQRYSKFLPEFCHISTPWFSAQEVFERHSKMMKRFPTLHNARKEK